MTDLEVLFSDMDADISGIVLRPASYTGLDARLGGIEAAELLLHRVITYRYFNVPASTPRAHLWCDTVRELWPEDAPQPGALGYFIFNSLTSETSSYAHWTKRAKEVVDTIRQRHG